MNENIRNQILAELKAARDIAGVAGDDRDLTADERGRIQTHMKLAADLKARDLNQADLAKQLTDLADGIGMNAPTGDEDRPKPDGYASVFAGKNANRPQKSLGESFVNSAEFKALMAQAPGGTFSKGAHINMQPYGVKDLLTGVNRTTGAGALLTPQQLGLLEPSYARPLTIRDLVTPGTTATNQIEYVKLISTTNNAAPVAEATSSGVISATGTIVTPVQGGRKPESAMAFEKATTSVKTIAHTMPATKRALSDAGQIRTLIDNFLLYGLDEELEDQIVSGNGVGENFLGVAATSGVQTQAAPSGTKDIFDTTRKALTKVQIIGKANPSAFVFSPLDYQDIDLKRDGEERFYGAGPFAMSTPRLWGLPVVQSQAIPAGTGYVADWKKAVLWDREQANISATDSHEDFFVRNLIMILAELRAAFALLVPAAFCTIDIS